MERGKTVLAAALLLLLVPWLARADWTWSASETTTLQLGSTVVELGKSKQDVSIKNNLVRVDEPLQGGAKIYNFQNQQVVLLSFNNRAFMQLGVSDLVREFAGQRSQLKSSLDQREQMAKAGPPERSKIELAKIAAQRKKYALWDDGAYSIRATEERKQIGGHECVKYEGLSGDEVFQEFWVAQDLPLDRDFKRFFAAGMVSLDPQQHTYWARLPGLPLKVVTRYGPVTVTDEIANPRLDPVPVDAFLIPEDFKEAATKVEGGG